MSRKATFFVTGIKEIDALLDDIEKKEAAKITRKVIRANQKIIQKAAKANAPKDTGDLAKQIKLVAGKRSNKTIQLFVRQMMPKDPDKKDIPYAFYQEYGSPKRGITPTAHMRRAFDSNQNAVREKTIEDIKKGLTEYWKRKTQ